MPYTIHQELRAYYEILEITENEIEYLLYLDHPPLDYLDQIESKRQLTKDIKWLIRDIQVEIAVDSFQKLTF
jgi:carboxypeptidase C (cathepsin A)